MDLMNGALRRAVEEFNDDKILYIDINPAFEGHRFCEPGHSWYDQLNYSKKVFLWNSPGRQFVDVKDGNDLKTYELGSGTPLPQDVFDKLISHPEGQPKLENGLWISTFRDPQHPELSMEWKARPEDLGPAGGVGDGYKARTLHPTEDAHRAIGKIINQRLAQIYGRSSNPTIVLPPSTCAPGCTCSESGALLACS